MTRPWIALSLLMLLVVGVWLMRDQRSPVPPAAPPAPSDATNTPRIDPAPNALQQTALMAGHQRRVSSETTSRFARPSPTDGADSPRARMEWDGPANVRAGSLFSVALRMTSEVSVRVVPMQLRFDPELLELVSVRPGAYFGDGAHFGYHVNRPGSIRIGATAETPIPAADTELIVVTFRSLRPETVAELRISALELEASAGPVVYEGIAPFTTAVTR